MVSQQDNAATMLNKVDIKINGMPVAQGGTQGAANGGGQNGNGPKNENKESWWNRLTFPFQKVADWWKGSWTNKFIFVVVVFGLSVLVYNTIGFSAIASYIMNFSNTAAWSWRSFMEYITGSKKDNNNNASSNPNDENIFKAARVLLEGENLDDNEMCKQLVASYNDKSLSEQESTLATLLFSIIQPKMQNEAIKTLFQNRGKDIFENKFFEQNMSELSKTALKLALGDFKSNTDGERNVPGFLETYLKTVYRDRANSVDPDNADALLNQVAKRLQSQAKTDIAKRVYEFLKNENILDRARDFPGATLLGFASRIQNLRDNFENEFGFGLNDGGFLEAFGLEAQTTTIPHMMTVLQSFLPK